MCCAFQVFDIGKNSKPPITGLEFHKIPNTDKYVIDHCYYPYAYLPIHRISTKPRRETFVATSFQ